MREIHQIHALAQLPMGRAPLLISDHISRMVCDIYAEHKKHSERCEKRSVLNDVFLTGLSLNNSHLTVAMSIPWSESPTNSAATIFFLMNLPKPMINGRLAIYSISEKLKHLYTKMIEYENTKSCSKFNNSVLCTEQPRMTASVLVLYCWHL